MADPISLAASIGTIVGGAYKLAQALYDIVDTVRNAPQELSLVAQSLHHDATLLGCIIQLIEQHESLFKKRLEEVVRDVNWRFIIVHDLIRKCVKGKGRMLRLRWLIRKRHVLDLMHKLEGLKHTMKTVLSIAQIAEAQIRSRGFDVRRYQIEASNAVENSLSLMYSLAQSATLPEPDEHNLIKYSEDTTEMAAWMAMTLSAPTLPLIGLQRNNAAGAIMKSQRGKLPVLPSILPRPSYNTKSKGNGVEFESKDLDTRAMDKLRIPYENGVSDNGQQLIVTKRDTPLDQYEIDMITSTSVMFRSMPYRNWLIEETPVATLPTRLTLERLLLEWTTLDEEQIRISMEEPKLEGDDDRSDTTADDDELPAEFWEPNFGATQNWSNYTPHYQTLVPPLLSSPPIPPIDVRQKENQIPLQSREPLSQEVEKSPQQYPVPDNLEQYLHTSPPQNISSPPGPSATTIRVPTSVADVKDTLGEDRVSTRIAEEIERLEKQWNDAQTSQTILENVEKEITTKVRAEYDQIIFNLTEACDSTKEALVVATEQLKTSQVHWQEELKRQEIESARSIEQGIRDAILDHIKDEENQRSQLVHDAKIEAIEDYKANLEVEEANKNHIGELTRTVALEAVNEYLHPVRVEEAKRRLIEEENQQIIKDEEERRKLEEEEETMRRIREDVSSFYVEQFRVYEDSVDGDTNEQTATLQAVGEPETYKVGEGAATNYGTGPMSRTSLPNERRGSREDEGTYYESNIYHVPDPPNQFENQSAEWHGSYTDSETTDDSSDDYAEVQRSQPWKGFNYVGNLANSGVVPVYVRGDERGQTWFAGEDPVYVVEFTQGYDTTDEDSVRSSGSYLVLSKLWVDTKALDSCGFQYKESQESSYLYLDPQLSWGEINQLVQLTFSMREIEIFKRIKTDNSEPNLFGPPPQDLSVVPIHNNSPSHASDFDDEDYTADDGDAYSMKQTDDAETKVLSYLEGNNEENDSAGLLLGIIKRIDVFGMVVV